MSITVEDCLKLPALREATVVAGHAGLKRVVSAVSVIEYPNVSLLSSEVAVGNELLISALVYIKDDVEQQCRLLKHLYTMGEACLVLYYIGVFIEKLDDKLMQTADELGFPLITMPIGQMNFRYSDVVSDVSGAIYKDRSRERYYVSELVNQISQLSPQFQTMKSVLRIISDRLRCSILLTDRYMTPKASATWPISTQLDYQALLEMLLGKKIDSEHSLEIQFQGRTVSVWDVPVVTKKHAFHLFAIDEHGEQCIEDLTQASEVIELFLNIWNRDVNYEGTDALVHAILSDQPAEKERLAAKMNIDIEPIHTIWILRLLTTNGDSVNDSQHLACMRQLKQFLQERHKLVIVDSYSKYLIALSDDSLFEDTELTMANSLALEMMKDNIVMEGVICQGVENTAQAREAYLLSDANWDAVHCIFREKRIFTIGEIRFVQRCNDILAEGEKRVSADMRSLRKIQDLTDSEDLVETLCTYLLDAGSNVQKTGSMMFLHKNTVKYRLNKIRATLNYDLQQMPETYEMYQAAALYRLLHKQ